MYCALCGAPFVPFDTIPGLEKGTQWLNQAVILDSGLCIKNYDSYGRFTDCQTGQSVDACWNTSHQACNKLPEIASCRLDILRRFQEQFFDIGSLIVARKTFLLKEPGTIERRIIAKWRRFVATRHAAATLIQKAYRLWRFRMTVWLNPNTQAGAHRLRIATAQWGIA
jgi:hypothetical protein